MPQVLGPLVSAILAPLAVIGAPLGLTGFQVLAIGAPVGFEVDDAPDIPRDETCSGRLHVWPAPCQSRKELIAFLSNGTDLSTPMVQSYANAVASKIAELARHSVSELQAMVAKTGMASMDVTMNIVPAMDPLRAEMEQEAPGLFDRLISKGKWPHLVTGFCLDPIVPDGSLAFSDDGAPINRGDVVNFVAHGMVMPGMKVFLGEQNGRAYFCATKPACIMAVEVKDLIHVAKITTIKRRGSPAAEVGNVRDSLPSLARQRMDTLPTRPFDAPKARNGLYALDEAFQGIYLAFAAMPSDAPLPFAPTAAKGGFSFGSVGLA